jgi:hypothetical protein
MFEKVVYKGSVEIQTTNRATLLISCNKSISTFFVMAILDGCDSSAGFAALPVYFKILHRNKSSVPFKFVSKRTRTNRLNISIGCGGTYTNSVAFRSIFKMKDRDIRIIPLPHASSANYKYWVNRIGIV